MSTPRMVWGGTAAGDLQLRLVRTETGPKLEVADGQDAMGNPRWWDWEAAEAKPAVVIDALVQALAGVLK